MWCANPRLRLLQALHICILKNALQPLLSLAMQYQCAFTLARADAQRSSSPATRLVASQYSLLLLLLKEVADSRCV
jgi:hypothetical protein